MRFKLNLSKPLLSVKRIYRSQKRQIICGVLACLFCACIAYYNFTKLLTLGIQNRLVGIQLTKLQNEVGCDLPKLDPFSKEAMAYSQDMRNLPALVCNGGPDWVTCRKSECFVKADILKKFNNIECTYQDIVYVRDDYYFLAKPIKIIGGDKYPLKRSDHVKVSCISLDEENSAMLPQRWHGHKAGFRPLVIPRSAETNNSVNVLILAIDSASHNGFIRGMPKSYKYLKDTIKAVFLNGHNIVGDGTPAALFPIMTGKAESEQPDRQKSFGSKKYFDHKSFIFHLVKEHGYRTAYFEDMPWVGTFQYRFNGFDQQPADHYLRAFLLEESLDRKNWLGKYRFRHCIGSEPSYQLMLNLTGEFMQLEGKKFIFTLMVDLAHDDFNLISNGDNDTLRFLQMFVQQKMMEDTLLIVMGDHGSRYEGVRNTQQGRLEERLPLVSVSLPARFPRRAHLALRHNAAGLTTHFDLHSTLLHVLGLSRHANLDTVPGANIPRAFSLLDEIPSSRTCSEAGILPHWCVCVKWYHLSQGDVHYQRVANYLADYVDGLSDNKRDKCVERKLTSIEWVMKQNPNDMLKYPRSPLEGYVSRFRHNEMSDVMEYYQAKIIMSPGEAIFEGTLTYNLKSDSFYITERDISRIDLYGNESECIRLSHSYLLKYCYCKDKLLLTSDHHSTLRHFF